MKTSTFFRRACAPLIALPLVLPAAGAGGKGREKDIVLTPVGTYSAKIFDRGAAEIVAHDPATQRLFVVNGARVVVDGVPVVTPKIDVLSIADPASPSLLFSIDVTPFGDQANSVAVRDGIVAAAVQAEVKTDPGRVVFFDASGNYLNAVTVGALPDMLTFTPNGRMVLVANEGEPNSYGLPDSADPEGSVSIIDLRAGVADLTQADVTNAGFAAFDSAALDPSIRVFGPGAGVAQDLEPEYIAVSHDSGTAWVTLQENNAVGVLDLRAGAFTRLIGLGFKDHRSPGNGLDPSDLDGTNNIANWPVFGMYQPDAVAAFRSRGETFLVTANEGDAREYAGLTEEARVGAFTSAGRLRLDPAAFPDAPSLQTNARLARLNVTRALGDADGDGDYDRLYAFGARSFSVRDSRGNLVFDSGDQFEQITKAYFPSFTSSFFNASNTNNTRDDRSDNKGPEPEGLVVGKAFGRTYLFICLERVGGVMAYDLTEPSAPRFVQYVNNRDFGVAPRAGTEAGTVGDLGPEGLLFIGAEEGPAGRPLLVVANEVSGTTTVYEVAKAD